MALSKPVGKIFYYIFMLFLLRSFFVVQNLESTKTPNLKKWSTQFKAIRMQKSLTLTNRYSTGRIASPPHVSSVFSGGYSSLGANWPLPFW